MRLPAAQIAERVLRRVDEQFERGLLDEMRGLLARGVPETARPFGGLVYRQALEHLHGVRDEASTRALIAQENRRYARRQLIWFRKEPNLIWLDGPGESPSTIAAAAHLIEQRRRRTQNVEPQDVTVQAPGPASGHENDENTKRNSARAVFVIVVLVVGSKQSRSEFAVSSTFTRAIVIVMDSVGIGELPDASAYGDEGSDTIGNIARQVPLQIPTLRRLGLGRVARIGDPPPPALPAAAVGRMAEASAGKDSVTGHWEMMGIVLDRPFPVFPDGILGGHHRRVFHDRPDAASLATRRRPAREIIDELGPEHMRTGSLIVYTSADSVFQIAAHEDVVPVPELYRACEIAYRLVGEGLGVGRVIARPFVGVPGHFKRTANRHDYALPPSGETLLDRVKAAQPARRRRSARSRTCSPAAA